MTLTYQNGAGALLNEASSKSILRQAVVSGKDASLWPVRKRQVAPVENRTAASAAVAIASTAPTHDNRVMLFIVFNIPAAAGPGPSPANRTDSALER